MLVTPDVSKFDEKVIPCNEIQLLNIEDISVILDVLNFDKSKLIKDLQLLNIFSILVTLFVSKEFKSRPVSCSQFLNIEAIETTLDVSKLDISK